MKPLHPLALVLLCLLTACSKHTTKDIPAQSTPYLEVKVLSVEKTDQKVTVSDGAQSQAKEDSEVVVAEVSFRRLPGNTSSGPTLIRAELETVGGQRYEVSAFGGLDQGPMRFPFVVPKGAELKTLRVADLTFDLR